jgi:hypothetical protein
MLTFFKLLADSMAEMLELYWLAILATVSPDFTVTRTSALAEVVLAKKPAPKIAAVPRVDTKAFLKFIK